MHAYRFIAASLFLALASFQSAAAERVQEDKVNLTVVKYDDHVQIECNPVTIDTAMHSDWKAICNETAAPQVRKLVAAGTIAPVKGPVFDLSASRSASGTTLSKSIALLKPRH
jgi:hypothetical protein